MGKTVERILDVLDSDAADTLWVTGDFIICAVGLLACFSQSVSGSGFLVPNFVWWVFTGFIAISFMKALGDLADFCDVSEYEEDLEDSFGGDE